jgi:hypothetical protein
LALLTVKIWAHFVQPLRRYLRSKFDVPSQQYVYVHSMDQLQRGLHLR